MDTEKIWLEFHRFQKSREKYYVPKIQKELQKQVSHFIDNGLTQTSLSSIGSIGLLKLLKELYLDAATVYGARVIANLRKQKSRLPNGFRDEMDELIENYFRYELLNNVEDITQETRKKIQEILIDANEKGLSNYDIVKQLTAIEFTRIRARLIARTETNTAANQGAIFSAMAVGATKKVWIAAKDFRTRRSPRDAKDHLHMDGVEVGFTEYFIVSGEKMYQPCDRRNGATAGNICNCRCTVGFK